MSNGTSARTTETKAGSTSGAATNSAGGGDGAAPVAAPRPALRDWIERLLPFASVVALFIVLTILSPYFLTVQNLSSVARQTAVINIIALGMTLIMISGGIDLSVGSVMAFAGICGTLLLQAHFPLTTSILGAMLAGMAWGLLNSLLITLLKVSQFIATLGTMGAARGLTLVFTHVMTFV